MKLVKPPSYSCASTFTFIGKNRRGMWIAREQNGLYGGLFVSRAEAIKFVLSANGRRPESIIELSREIELDTNGELAAPDRKSGIVPLLRRPLMFFL